MSYTSHHIAASRVFDCLYDPTFITSDSKDVRKSNNEALTRSATINIIPVYRTMFTELPRQPRNLYMLRQNPLPHFNYYGGGDADQAKKTSVLGADSIKYYSAPLTTSKKIDFNLNLKDCRCIPVTQTPEPKQKNMQCQTMYRETSAQTRPWMPMATINAEEPQTPEIVNVADLIQGDGPPGVYEAEIVERARKQRIWESTLAPLKSIVDWDKRRTVLEAFEWEQWISREEEIEDCQQLRLDLVKRLMKKRQNKQNISSDAKMQNTKTRIEQEKSKKIKKIRHEHKRCLRKLEMRHNNYSKKYLHFDVTKEHIDRASDLYGPQLRFGQHPQQNHYKPHKTAFEARLENYEQMETKPSNLAKYVNPKGDLWKPKELCKETQRGLWNDLFLKNIYTTLKRLREQRNSVQTMPKCVQLLPQKSISIAETPLGPEEETSNELEYQFAILFQKLIKGRSSQTIIYKGRNKCRGLIAELQSTHQLEAVNAMYPGQSNDLLIKRRLVRGEQTRVAGLLKSQDQIQEVLKEAEGSPMIFLLSFLQQELDRLQEQRHAHALYMLAEKERFKREAAEAGQRQTEEQRRREHNEAYRNVMRSTDDIATLYLENVILQKVDQIADEKAREKVQQMARNIDIAAEDLKIQEDDIPEKVDTPLTDENIVSDLVNHYLFPEVYKQIARRNMKLRQQRHLLAAHNAIYEHIEKIPIVEIPLGSAEKISQAMLRELIEEVVSSDTSMSPISSDLNIAQNEAMSAIRKAIRKTIPGKKEYVLKFNPAKCAADQAIEFAIDSIFKSTTEKKEKPCICEHAKQRKKSQYDLESLQKIISSVNLRLWTYADKQAEEKSSETIQFDDK